MDGVGADRLEPHEIAFLRGGRRAALTVAVLTLRLRGAVGSDRYGLLRATRPLDGTEEGHRPVPGLARVVHAALRTPADLRDLLMREAVTAALVDLRYELADAGLLRAPLPGRTRAGRRLLRTLRNRSPLPTTRRGLSSEDRLLAVALYGDRALTSLMPRFAREGGLVGRGRVTRRNAWETRGGGSSCGAACGAGCGAV